MRFSCIPKDLMTRESSLFLQNQLSMYEEDPYPLFLYWMREREKIRIRREEGKSWPWTKDPIFQAYRFCNVFRIDDKVTQQYIKWINRLDGMGYEKLIFNTMMFRLFNHPPTTEEIGIVTSDHEMKRVLSTLNARKKRKEKIFTGVFMVTGNAWGGGPKHQTAARSLKMYWEARKEIAETVFGEDNTLKGVTEKLAKYPMFAFFLGYEVACDLSYIVTGFPDDEMTWTNIGPGARRGLNKLHRRRLKEPLTRKKGVKEALELFKHTKKRWKGRPLTMREIEHSLCEFDKYTRVLTGEGVPRNLYKRED